MNNSDTWLFCLAAICCSSTYFNQLLFLGASNSLCRQSCGWVQSTPKQPLSKWATAVGSSTSAQHTPVSCRVKCAHRSGFQVFSISALSVFFSVLIAFWLEYMWWPLRWLNRASGMFNNCVFSRWMFCEHEYWHYKYTWGMYGNK